MSLLRKWTLDGLAAAGTVFWDEPTSAMGVASPGSEDAAGGGDADNAGNDDDVDDGQGDDRGDGDEGDRRADARGRRGSAEGDDDDDQDDDEPDDEDDELDESRPIEERFKKVLKAKRREERRNKKLRPLAERLKEAGVSLDDLMLSHRQLANMQRRMEENPRLRELLGEGTEDRHGDRGGRKADREPFRYPFKTDNPSGQFFQKLHEDFQAHVEDVVGRLDQLEKRLTTESQSRQGERAQSFMRDGHAAATTASKAIPEGFRDLFMHAVGLDMRRALRGEIRATPQQIIDHHLGKLRKKGAIGKDTKNRASDAARERMARHNDNLPRRPAGNGGPGPRKDKPIPRMADFNRNLRARFGGAG